MNVLELRAKKLQQLRHYFSEQQVLEVDTPLLRQYSVTDPYMSAMAVVNPNDKFQGFLQTSPEYAMKMLLCSGSGDIYQLSKVFRAEESGPHHSSEFTMLEWYRTGWSYTQLMGEVYQVIQLVAGARSRVNYTYQQAFQHFLGIDPFDISIEELDRVTRDTVGEIPEKMLFDNYLTLLFASEIEPNFDPDKVTFVYDFPPSQASLAKTNSNGENPVACRFEAFSGGLELANGFEELTDCVEQKVRFEQDNQIRKELGYAQQEIDTDFLNSMARGLPYCSGVAIGFDRLLMLNQQAKSIEAILPMSFVNKE